MDVLFLGGGAYLVYIRNEYLNEKGLTPASLSPGDILSSLPSVATRVTVELFSGVDGLLVFVRRTQMPIYYEFSSLEELIAAAWSFEDCGGTLWLSGGYYVLAVSERGSLDDYGRRALFRSLGAKILIKNRALGELRRIFSQNTL